MTVKQFCAAAAIARLYGKAKLKTGSTLYNHGYYWSITDSNGNTIDTANDPGDLEYLFD